MRWQDGAQPGESAGRDDKLITINNYHVARDENGMGKSRSDRHRFPYKPTVYRFDRKNRNRKKTGKTGRNRNENRGALFLTVFTATKFHTGIPIRISPFPGPVQSALQLLRGSLALLLGPRPKPSRLQQNCPLNPSSHCPPIPPRQAPSRRPPPRQGRQAPSRRPPPRPKPGRMLPVRPSPPPRTTRGWLP